MKKPVEEYTTDELRKRLSFAQRIENDTGEELSGRLGDEKAQVTQELNKRNAAT